MKRLAYLAALYLAFVWLIALLEDQIMALLDTEVVEGFGRRWGW